MLNLNVFQKYAMFWCPMTKVYPQVLMRIMLFSTVCFALLVLFLQTRLPVLSQQEVELPVRYGAIKGTLWLPSAPTSAQLPGVLLVHGMASSRRNVQSLAKTLAYQGMVVFTPDLRGYGASISRGDGAAEATDATLDVDDSLAFLRGHPAVNPQAIAVLGHSLGASLVARLDADVSPVLRIGLSMHPEEPGVSAVQWWTGLYDPLHPPYLANFQYVSPCASHGMAPEDICVKQQLLKTLSTAFHERPNPVVFWLGLAQQACMIGLGLSLVGLWAWGPLAPGGYSLLFASLAGCIVFGLAGYFRWLYPAYCATAMALFTLGYLLRLSLHRKRVLMLFTWGGVAYLAHVSASVLRGLFTLGITSMPLADIRYLPLFLIQSLMYLPLWVHDKVLTLFFQQHYARVEPTLIFWFFWGVEMLWPGRVVSVLDQVLLFLTRPDPGRISLPKVACLGILLCVLLGVGVWRLEQGYLSIKIVQNLMGLSGGVILPGLFFFWLYYRVFLRKCPRDDSNIRPTV